MFTFSLKKWYKSSAKGSLTHSVGNGAVRKNKMKYDRSSHYLLFEDAPSDCVCTVTKKKKQGSK